MSGWGKVEWVDWNSEDVLAADSGSVGEVADTLIGREDEGAILAMEGPLVL